MFYYVPTLLYGETALNFGPLSVSRRTGSVPILTIPVNIFPLTSYLSRVGLSPGNSTQRKKAYSQYCVSNIGESVWVPHQFMKIRIMGRLTIVRFSLR